MNGGGDWKYLYIVGAGFVILHTLDFVDWSFESVWNTNQLQWVIELLICEEHVMYD
jgi:hypothetical protein